MPIYTEIFLCDNFEWGNKNKWKEKQSNFNLKNTSNST